MSVAPRCWNQFPQSHSTYSSSAIVLTTPCHVLIQHSIRGSNISKTSQHVSGGSSRHQCLWVVDGGT